MTIALPYLLILSTAFEVDFTSHPHICSFVFLKLLFGVGSSNEIDSRELAFEKNICLSFGWFSLVDSVFVVLSQNNKTKHL
jgi:hypothetical protein